MLKVGLITQCELGGLTDDDRPLFDALRHKGLEAISVAWDDPGTDPTACDALVIRSPWNYYLQHEKFFAWMSRVEGFGVPIWNPPSLIRWNSNKFYLEELAIKGAPLIPSVFVRPGQSRSLQECFASYGVDRIIIKPVVSAGAYETHLVQERDTARHEQTLQRLVAGGGAIVQPFCSEIVREGEWSFVFLGGSFSHSLLKTPAESDFRVQEQYEGTWRYAEAPAVILEQARHITTLIPGPWLYARIDGIVREGRFLLMELEAFEPSLFFGGRIELADAFAAAVERVLRS